MLAKKIKKDSSIKFRVLEQDKKIIRKAAKSLDTSVSKLILDALDEYITKHCGDLKE